MEGSIRFLRGSHQIGGVCTEIVAGDERILIDFGTNLPGSDEDAQVSDAQLVEQVQKLQKDAILFTHYHGDHVGLYGRASNDTRFLIGELSKKILEVTTPYIDNFNKEKKIDIVKNFETYKAVKNISGFKNMSILPLYVDHSAIDSHMFYIEIGDKKILYTGDFREHGIVGQNDRLWRLLEKFVPKNIDYLITEGTMLSREEETQSNIVKTESDLGLRARGLFNQKKYNFVMVSSTNFDSIMEFYQNTPKGMYFIADYYQLKLILTVMKGMEDKGIFPEYRTSEDQPTMYMFGYKERNSGQRDELQELANALKYPITISFFDIEDISKTGFVMLVRKPASKDYNSVFEKMIENFYRPINRKESQIIYSLWSGYLHGDKKDPGIVDFIGDKNYIQLHTSGHAYVETLIKLIEQVEPKNIIPMHTELADSMVKLPAFDFCKDRIKVLQDGEKLEL